MISKKYQQSPGEKKYGKTPEEKRNVTKPKVTGPPRVNLGRAYAAK